jgi:hypothetical protein
MPGPESGGLDNFWFSFNIGPVHWVSMSSQVSYFWLIIIYVFENRKVKTHTIQINASLKIVLQFHFLRKMVFIDYQDFLSHNDSYLYLSNRVIVDF